VSSRATRENLITHVRATLAYLEVNRDAIKAKRVWRWPVRKTASAAAAGKKEAIKDGVQRSKLLH
jgi:cellulase/cellobiase CelA1